MNIALDYDDTFTSDPQMWRKIIAILKEVGHDVRIVTSRFYLFESEREIKEATGLDVIFCKHNYKLEVTRKIGFNVDIWIDDNPGGILGVDQ
jgi:hydroxymethylpyrimidine pyrophosphatase-like HAD family hydrolase